MIYFEISKIYQKFRDARAEYTLKVKRDFCGAYIVKKYRKYMKLHYPSAENRF